MDDDQVEAPLVANFNGNPRIQWTPVLHDRFLLAVKEHGGPFVAKPKAIKDTMGAHGLTLRHIKSHLQKYRATFVGERSRSDMKNEEQPEDANSATLPNMAVDADADAMGGHEVYDVSQVQTGTEGIFSLAPTATPYDIGGHKFHDVLEVQNGTEGIPSQVPDPYDVGGLEVHGVSEVPIGTVGVPTPYDIGHQNDYGLCPIRNEESPYLMPAHNIGSHEVYDISGLQIGTDDIQGADKEYTDTFTDGRCTNDTGKQIEDSASVVDFQSEVIWSPDWEPTPYDMGYQEFYGEPTTLLGIEGGFDMPLEDPQNYTGSLDISSYNKEGTMGVHPKDVLSHQFECPTENMPSCQMLPTPYGIGGHELYDGLSLQRSIGSGIQQVRDGSQNYTGGLDITNNDKGKGTMGVHLEEVVAHQFECPTNNMPLCHMSSTPYRMGGHEFCQRPSLQRAIERGVQEARYESQNYMGNLDNSSNNKGKGTMGTNLDDVVAHHFEYTDNMPLCHMSPTPYGIRGHEFYDGDMQRAIQRGVKQTRENYTGSLNIGNNQEGKGTIGMHSEDVASHLECPTNMTSCHVLPTSYGMGGYEFCGGSSVQRGTQGGVQQANEVDKMTQDDENTKYMKSLMVQAYQLFNSDWPNSTTLPKQ